MTPDRSAIRARHVVLALGAPREPAWPDWAKRARPHVAEGSIQHVFDPGVELEAEDEGASVAVVGAGITGAQVALRLAREGRRVTLFSRHELRVEQFDSDPGWLGPKHMAGFARVRCPVERREIIRAARHRGSMPQDVRTALGSACIAGEIELVIADIEHVETTGSALELVHGDQRCRVDRVLLATGFGHRRPGEAWLDELIAANDLPCAPCGYPIVDRSLRWHPRVFVTGPLAELELGPASRNLSGARRAAERIAAHAAAGSGEARPDASGVASLDERRAIARDSARPDERISAGAGGR